MHNNAGRAVTLTWLLLNRHSTVDLIANAKMLVNTSTVRGEDAIRVHCNRGVNIVDIFGDIPGYGTVWYEPIGIANILSMLMATKKFWFVFDSEGGHFSGWSSRKGK